MKLLSHLLLKWGPVSQVISQDKNDVGFRASLILLYSSASSDYRITKRRMIIVFVLN
jgi:hypothetical protein